ncbi:sulfate transporter [Spiribacter sp. C176]|uniref:Sulfate transporter n=1 Tax=Spiribacter salilacus TaxID=2664894 RepID=A0A6N7QN87_9GAMM|nr:sulfate transporter [Spiribacter salilacus]
MRRRILGALVGLFLAASVPADDQKFITLASTTSTEHSGLFEFIVPIFQAQTGISVRVVAVGTGQALAIGCNGDADAVLVHAPAAEQQFVADGCGIDRRAVMFNDFVVVGPKDDPAGVLGADTVAEGFERIAQAKAPFASRGDDSGTHKKELLLWADVGIKPTGAWYRELGAGMGAALNTAAAMQAYTLADRATWLSFSNRQGLSIVFQGDQALHNPYSSILVNPNRHPVKVDLARVWHDWLVSEAGQTAISQYQLNGHQLFTPN